MGSEDDFDEKMGRMILAIRQELSIRQTQLAEAIGISQAKLSLVEQGLRSVSAEEFYLLCKAYNLSADSLLLHCRSKKEKRRKSPFAPKFEQSFKNQDLTGADLSNKHFSFSDFTNANLKHANLSGACFLFSRFWGADLTGANLRGATFCGADFRGTKKPTILICTKITDVDFRHAHYNQKTRLPFSHLEAKKMEMIMIRPTLEERIALRIKKPDLERRRIHERHAETSRHLS